MDSQNDINEKSNDKRLHYLLTSIGTNPQEIEYTLDGKSEKGRFSFEALIKLLNNKIDQVVILVTEDAKPLFEEFKKEFKNKFPRMEITSIDVKKGISPDEVKAILSNITKKIPENCDLTIDITNGLRHYPFLLFTSALYMQSFRNVIIKNIFYSLVENKKATFVDLNYLLVMVNLFHAVSMFSELKNSSKLYNILSDNIKDPKIKKLFDKMKEFDSAFNLGLTLSTGDYAKSFVDQFYNKMDSLKELYESNPIPLLQELMDYVSESIDPYKLDKSIKTNTNDWKKSYRLSKDELNRQKNIIDDYIKSKHYNNAIQLMREWVISRCIYQENRNDKWLDPDERKKIENLLGSLKWRLEKGILSGEKKELAEIWDKITSIRNMVAHNEMNVQGNNLIDEKDKEPNLIKELWEEIKNKNETMSNTFWNPKIQGNGGKLLVSPLGLSPGLLYSAIKLVNPDKCIVITSENSKKSLNEILEKSSYSYNNICKIIELKDPFTGYDEIKNIIDNIQNNDENNGNNDDIFKCFEEFDEIAFNLTGGTTTMQILVEELYKIANHSSKKTDRIIIIDRRSTEQQKANPYVVGEMISLKNIFNNPHEDD
ncbi:MAG: TM1812 family CRISPR-associated protein [Thermoplasmata archaeon]